jgi:hypothetical protein
MEPEEIHMTTTGSVVWEVNRGATTTIREWQIDAVTAARIVLSTNRHGLKRYLHRAVFERDGWDFGGESTFYADRARAETAAA